MVNDRRVGRNGASAVSERGEEDSSVSVHKPASRPSKSTTTAKSAARNGIVTVEAFCVGLTSLLMDPMTEETLIGLETGIHPQINKQEPIESVVARKVYRNEDGAIALPIENFFACLVGAGRKVKLDPKAKISTLDSTTLPDYFWLQTDDLLLTDREGNLLNQEGSWVADRRRGRLDSGVAVSIRRPKFNDWGFKVVFEFDEAKIAEGKLIELFAAAGHVQGLGSFRPSCKGPFGTFEVRRWKLLSRREVTSNFERIDLTEENAA